MKISEFIKHHYRHFNAASVVDAAEAYNRHIDAGGQMMVTLAGAMSTAELGISLAEMIRKGKVHAISCTGANLEEDIFNLVAHDHYVRIPDWRDLSPKQEQELHDRHMNRVTDTCIPEEEAIRRLEDAVLDEWTRADKAGERYFPHEFFYRILLSGRLKKFYQIDPKDSWLLAAAQKTLPIVVPGWEDSTLGNIYAAHCIEKDVKNVHTVRSGVEYMTMLAEWYTKTAKPMKLAGARADESKGQRGEKTSSSISVGSIGFFQIGGGIAGDFPICVVPMLHQDLRRTKVPLWGYFCQISDAPTSYGGYSGAIPNEKITWGKLAIDTPKFVIESDASIVAPLVFAHVLGW
ncbi:MAG: deoxyhypusine synthase family protein [Phycisphaerales bacterium]|nr:deoxyhypusine synthase family protein [Phycisphaerales bacterium]MCI0630071.1 deoxyhypusine synthase family protein [Phycisphaerales bacterium]MCI0676936.1 deoxyhypusine synthase family protein [Phycisphaerales bacterium]